MNCALNFSGLIDLRGFCESFAISRLIVVEPISETLLDYFIGNLRDFRLTLCEISSMEEPFSIWSDCEASFLKFTVAYLLDRS